MNYSDQIIKLIDEVSKRLQIPFERAMEIAVKQLRYMVIMDWIWIVVSLIILVGFVFIYIKSYDGIGESFVMDVMIPVISLALLIAIISCVSQLIQISVNPDYAIIKLITNMIK